MNPRRNTDNTNVKYFYVKIPFIADKVNWKLKSIFQSENIKVRFYHTNK
jgi:hypothetical protein